LMSSLLTVHNLYNNLEVHIVFGGESALSFVSQYDNFTINPANVQFVEDDDNGEDPYVTFTLIGGYFAFTGTWNIPGQIVVESGNMLLAGNIAITGGLYATMASANIVVSGSLYCGDPVVLGNTSMPSSFVLTNGSSLTAPIVQIHENFSLSTSANSIFNVSEFINRVGVVYASQKNALTITGMYTQMRNGGLVAYDLDASAGHSAVVRVGSSAFIDGQLKYNTSGAINSRTQFVVVEAKSINGNFSEHAVFGSDENVKNLDFSISTSNTTITITLSPQVKRVLGLEWWVWLLIGVGAFVQVVAAVVIARKIILKRRLAYKPI